VQFVVALLNGDPPATVVAAFDRVERALDGSPILELGAALGSY